MNEAKARLRWLSQKGRIREHVKEFSTIILEIPNYTNREALFAFMY